MDEYKELGKALSKYQKFDVDVISREMIHGADYNPRTISADAKRRLQSMLEKHGLVQPLVWNKRTGNLVAGHKRLEILDALEGNATYKLQVAVLDVDDYEEKLLNVQLNNTSMQGSWDMTKLIELKEMNDIDPLDWGFSAGDVAVMFGTNEYFNDIVDDVPEVEEAKSTLEEIKQDRSEMVERLAKEQSANFYFTVVCESAEQKAAIMKEFNTPEWETFVNGKTVAEYLGL